MKKNNKRFVRLTAIFVLICLCVSMAACAGQGSSGSTEPTGATGETGAKTTYTVVVQNEDGQPLTEVGVYVYTDSTLAELVWFAKTDAEGKVTFDDVTCEGYVAVLADVAEGYEVEETYPITGETTVIVVAGSAEGDLSKITYKLGDKIHDFSVTAADGTVYTLSELLEQKEAVVLNFWYLECNPCKAEFPYLQEAYEKYADQIEVLAMNPVNTDAAEVAAFQEANGLTFPMAVVDPNWEKAMQITGYPTTVVVDRTGTITLIHTGSIDNTDTFERIFNYFTADVYEPGVVESVDNLPELVKPGSSADNPIQTGSITRIDVTLEPGEKIYYQLYRVDGMYLSINNPNAFVEYNNTTYTPNNGKIGLTLSVPDTYTPAAVVFGNSGTETVTYTVSLAAAYGSFSNPIGVSLGEFDTTVYAGNSQGVYYAYYASEEGVLTITNVSVTPADLKYDYTLYNTSSYAVRSLGSDAEAGANSVSIPVKAGQRVMITVSTVPDSSFNYPGGSFTSLLSFEAGDVGGEDEVEKLTYTVTVTDAAGAPMSNVNISIDVDGTATPIATDASGVATISLPKGSYTATLTLPDGYTAETTTYTLTEEAPSVTVKLETVQVTMVDYTVTVQNPNGEAVANTMVIIGTKVANTDESGKAVFSLEKGNYTAKVVAPADMVSDAAGYTFDEDAVELTVMLEWKPGTVNNPIMITAVPYTTEPLAAKTEVYYNLFFAGAPILTVSQSDAYVIYNGTLYGVDASGMVTVQLENGHPMMPTTIIVGNDGDSKTGYTINLVYPEGTYSNPKVLTDISEFTTNLAEGNNEGYYYTWTAVKTGNLVFEVTGVTEGVRYDVIVSNNNTYAQKNIDADGIQAENGNMTVTIPVTEGDSLSIIVTALPDENWTYQAAEITVQGTVVTAEEPDSGETDTSAPESSTPESSTPESSEPDPSIPETSEPDPSTPSVPAEITYTVTVTDSEGALQSGIVVFFGDNWVGTTDETGKISVDMDPGEYVVTLYGTEAYYSSSVVTADAPDVTIAFAKEVDAEKVESLAVLNDSNAYILDAGTTHVELGTGKSYYSAENGNNCFFIFQPTEAGTYHIKLDNADLKLSHWGSTQFQFHQADASDNEGNYLEVALKDAQVGSVDFVIAIEVAEGISEAGVVITRVGEAPWDVTDEPWSNDWQSDYVPKTAEVPSGTIQYVDVINGTLEQYNAVYNEKDGYYHLNSVDGPVLYMILSTKEQYISKAPAISLDLMINGDGPAGGAPLRKYFYQQTESSVKDKSTFIKKEDYTELMKQYINCIDATYGCYPVTKDLTYMIQNGGEVWWDPNSESCVIEGANQDIAWMFACCYFE